MAARKSAGSSQESVTSGEKIARLMALSAIKDLESNIEKVVFLKTVGFVNQEIADMLNISINHVAVAVVQSRKQKRKKRK